MKGTGQKKRVLLVEDEPHLAFNLEFNLQAEGYDVSPAVTGLVAIEKFDKSGPFDLIILDVMLPEVDGFGVARHIRQKDAQTGILMLTARASEEDKVRGLEAGVDDYITKPFHLKELLLRVKRMTDRASFFATSEAEGKGTDVVLRFGDFQLDVDSLILSGPQGEHVLTALEADILKEFIQNPRKVLSREHLLKQVWGMKGDIETRTVDNFIVRLRRYIESDPSMPRLLVSIRGRGYKLNDGS